VILVEAKSHTPEIYGTGCQAREPSLTRIRRALSLTAEALATTATAPWESRLYQTANRLAHLHFLPIADGVSRIVPSHLRRRHASEARK